MQFSVLHSLGFEGSLKEEYILSTIFPHNVRTTKPKATYKTDVQLFHSVIQQQKENIRLQEKSRITTMNQME